MKNLIHRSATPSGAIIGAIIAAFLLLIVSIAVIIVSHVGAVGPGQKGGYLVTIHDRGTEQNILSAGPTVADALKEANVQLDTNDSVEPGLSEKLVANDNINIYRARPVIVIDGNIKEKIITSYQTPQQIAKSAGITLYPEDKTTLTQADDIVSQGAGLALTITRAVPFSFTLYGTTTDARTLGKTVGDMLKEKGITLAIDDRVSPTVTTPLTVGLPVRVWREGKQTITVSEAVLFSTNKIQDGDYNVGYDVVQTSGINGTNSVTYQVTIQDGQEVSRTKIASISTLQPVQQVEIVGVKVALSQGYSADRVAIMNAAGVASGDQGYVAFIIDHENASWCPTRWQGQAVCTASYVALHNEDAQTGYGLCQATPGNKMAAAGADWKTNPVTQMKWCTSYAVGRYGNWLAAYTFKAERGWW
jgi:uncharacterized protein YabE (DUF348 family)